METVQAAVETAVKGGHKGRDLVRHVIRDHVHVGDRESQVLGVGTVLSGRLVSEGAGNDSEATRTREHTLPMMPNTVRVGL